ncbi:fetuin-B-like [Anomaloglossus baeobatrachus]|uniref:fetuin-B-like n=1 Tax=Anomaloglossus baeobatrachus TaxID=238106 RepID=UPI003F509602
MERIFVVALLVSLCSATSPPHPNIISLDCNATEIQADLAVDLINEDRKEGFLFRPVRVESVFMQESVKLPGSNIYYVDLDVIETDCHVLSGKSWKECNNDIPFHETIFGHCKAIIFIARPWRILKLMNYNCTISPVPLRSVVHVCPDCPSLVRDISPKIEEKVNLVAEQFNKDSNNNETHYFKVDHIERVTTQYVFGQSYFFSFIVKETECLKTDSNVDLANCKFLKDSEAEVGFCKGSSFHTPDRKENVQGSCEIYDPKPDKHDHGHKHRHCHHGHDSSKTDQGQEKPDAPKVEEADVKQEGTGEAGQGKDVPDNCGHHKHGHCPHHGCRRHHHQHPHHHHRHHPHHHHHQHDQKNDNHNHDASHHHDHHHNHTSSHDGSSSEEHAEKKSFKKRSKGSIQFHFLSDDENSVPVPTIVRLPPPPQHPGKHGKHDDIEFPSEHSKLSTCPGEPLVVLPEIVKNFLFA